MSGLQCREADGRWYRLHSRLHRGLFCCALGELPTPTVEQLQQTGGNFKLATVENNPVDLAKRRVEGSQSMLDHRYGAGLGFDHQGNHVGLAQGDKGLLITEQGRGAQ